MTEKIKTELVNHRGQRRIKLMFSFDQKLINLVKKIDDARWSATMGCWHIPDNLNSQLELKKLVHTEPAEPSIKPSLNNIIENEKQTKQSPRYFLPALPIDKASALKNYIDWLRQARYSKNTIATYHDGLKVFFRFYHDIPLEEIDNAHLIRFNTEYIIKNKYSGSYQNQVVNGIKLFFSRLEKKQLKIEEIERPRRSHRLPDVFSKEEVEQLLRVTTNLKHKAILSLSYSCGLRRGELLNLTLQSVAANRGLLIIKGAKGNKDRVAPLSNKVIEMLRLYYKQYKPKKWLFEGQKKNEQYSETSMQEVFKLALSKAGIKKNATLHWLRHSYATHLLENGVDLRYIQEILGHKSSKTTEIYTHVTSKSIEKIKSPFDDLNL